MCHVPSLALAGKHTIICTWYAGSREGARDVAINGAFFSEENGTWSSPRVLVDRRHCSQELQRAVRKVGNAVVVNDNQGGLWLFYASMLLGGWSTTSLNYKVSRDGGQTWSDSRKLLLSPFFNLTNNVKNKGLNLSDGSFLLPVYQEFLHKFSQVLWFSPGTASPHYEIRKITHTGKAIQPALIPEEGKNLTAFFRNMASREKKFVLRAQSRDLGATWSPLTETSLPNPNSGFDMLKLPDGAYLGVINDSFVDRSNLTLVLSRDAGKTWKALKVLENKAGQEYSYPAILRGHRYYHVTYTYERKRIKQVIFSEAWLKGLEGYGN